MDVAAAQRDSREQFDALLARLAADGEVSAVGYEYLRRRLIMFFDVRAPADSEALTDLTLDRMARRLSDGVQIDDVRLYALGVARFILKEHVARSVREERALNDPTFAPPPNDIDDDETAAMFALTTCLSELGEANSTLILKYYQGDSRDRIRERQALAAALGVAINALRNRALRLREVLERCVGRRLDRVARDGSAEIHTTNR